ncbi:PIR Superfamily Protein [Plasmodium ovale curtisi]|uniref:PIR Superfamily Protein n=1 Tax=Plasmodium ovale curtisi TaxID=864141 RepID=A0A1A8WI09_PLAOA|nr:PIR Superfamily Protein [Plasmodium ovale curtisi]SBS99203.1 PIR Superfamily Protein [Plasmodium ovale curtisi]
MATEEDPDISSLQSEIIYHKLNRASKDYTKDSTEFWKTVITNHPMQKFDIFPTLVKGMYLVSTMNEEEYTFYDEPWNYLYFWSGLKVIENPDSSEDLEGSETSLFSRLMNLLKMVRSVNDKGNVNYDEDMLNITTKEFKDLKNIYDYLKNYETIHLKVGSSGKASCTPLFKDHLNTTHTLYTKEKQRCTHHTSNYCKVVNRFVLAYDKNNIRKLSCDGKKDPKKKPEMEDSQEDLEDSRLKLPSSKGDAETLQTASGLEGDSGDMEIANGIVSPSSGSTNAISTVFPLLGTTSLAFFLLKFTPLGPRLYNSIFGKAINRSNGEEEQEILQNSYQFAHGNMEENVHNVGYHSM